MYRPTFVWIYLSFFLMPTAFATSPSVATAPSEDIRKNLGTIGVVSGQFTPKVRFQGPESVKGAGAAAGRTAGRGLGKMWKGCAMIAGETAPTIFIPLIVIAGCVYATPFVTIFGGLHGGSDSGAAKTNRAAKAARKSEVTALRPVIDSALAAVATDNPLHTRLLEQVPAWTRGAVVGVTATSQVRYKDLRSQGIDTLLEVTVPRLDVSPENAFVLNARARLIRIADNTELRASTHTFEIAPRSVSEWTADGGATLRAALVSGYQELADKIVENLFSPLPPLARDPVHT